MYIMKAIIPCCGYGTRMNMKENESKELLPDPNNDNKPIIEWCLQQCYDNGITPCVVTRKEKADLINYCIDNSVEFIVIPPGEEWADTIVKAESIYKHRNVMILPDTRWSNLKALKDVKDHLFLGSEIVIGYHKPSNLDTKKWCMIHDGKLIEKPINLGEGYKYAMGIVGFVRGSYVFKELAEGSCKLNNTSFVDLGSFKDITRTGKVG